MEYLKGNNSCKLPPLSMGAYLNEDTIHEKGTNVPAYFRKTSKTNKNVLFFY
jgi:hypothetical protein